MSAVDAFDAFLRRPVTLEFNPYGERQIRKALPPGAPDDVVAHLVGIGEAAAASRSAGASAAKTAYNQPRTTMAGPVLRRRTIHGWTA